MGQEEAVEGLVFQPKESHSVLEIVGNTGGILSREASCVHWQRSGGDRKRHAEVV